MLFTMIASLFSALIHWRGCFLQVMNCPNMSELSLCFTEHSSDCTNLITLMDGLGRTCPNLEKMHISSKQLSNEAVCALENANLRYLSALLFPLQPSFWSNVAIFHANLFNILDLYHFDFLTSVLLLVYQGTVHAIPDSRFKNNWCSCCIYCSVMCKLGITWFKWVSSIPWLWKFNCYQLSESCCFIYQPELVVF